ncbi:hypothetical protein ACJX0J_007802, partial [Zea mays]
FSNFSIFFFAQEHLYHKYLIKNWYWPISSSNCLTHLLGILVSLVDFSGFVYARQYRSISIFLCINKVWAQNFYTLIKFTTYFINLIFESERKIHLALGSLALKKKGIKILLDLQFFISTTLYNLHATLLLSISNIIQHL